MRVSLGLLGAAALALAWGSFVESGCASGTSAITPTSDASTAGDDDDTVNQPVPGDDDDDDDASVGGADAASGTGDASITDASDAKAAVDSGPPTCAAALALAQYTFDEGPQGWTHGVSDGQKGTSWPYDPWSWGTATAGPACPDAGCFGAELTENYAQCQRGYLVSPTIDLGKCAGQALQLTFQHGYAFWNDGTYFDGGVVFVSADNGATWQALDPGTAQTVNIQESIEQYACADGAFEVDGKTGYVGSSAGNAITVQLTIPAALVTSQTLIKFSMGSGVSSQTNDASTSRLYTLSGWRVDNVSLSVP
jgi:hypothetical protein